MVIERGRRRKTNKDVIKDIINRAYDVYSPNWLTVYELSGQRRTEEAGGSGCGCSSSCEGN